MFYSPQGLMMKKILLTQHNFYTVIKHPFARQLHEAIQVRYFILSDPTNRLNGKYIFEGCNLTDF